METIKNEAWNNLNEAVQKCEKCNLCKNRRKVVISKRNLEAQIMIIGDFSNQEDDKTGEPFSGGVGQLLKKCLEGIDLEEKNIYFANILKCKKDYMELNIQQSIQACMNYLRSEVSIIRPKIIVLLGNNVVKNILGQEFDIKEVHGKCIERKGVYFMPTWNPLDVIRDENKKIELWMELKQVKEKFLSL